MQPLRPTDELASCLAAWLKIGSLAENTKGLSVGLLKPFLLELLVSDWNQPSRCRSLIVWNPVINIGSLISNRYEVTLLDSGPNQFFRLVNP